MDKGRQMVIFTQRMAAIRARARSRAVRRPLVACSRLQAQGLISGSCVAPRASTGLGPRRAQGEAHLELRDAITWAGDSGPRMSRDARCEA